MANRRSTLAAAAATLLALVACRDSPLTPAIPEADVASRIVLGGKAVLDNGALLIRGDDTANEIAVTYTSDGVQVILDGQQEMVREPIRALHVDAGNGDNRIRYQQLVITDMDLTLVACGGSSGAATDHEQVAETIPESERYGGTAVVGIPTEMHSMSPLELGQLYPAVVTRSLLFRSWTTNIDDLAGALLLNRPLEQLARSHSPGSRWRTAR